MATISKEVNIDILEKLPDGTFKKKNPSTTIENISKLREELDSLEHEAGSNDDGSYIRFGNGRQICWNEKIFADRIAAELYGEVYSTSAVDWNFPKSFSSLPLLIPTARRFAGGGAWGGHSGDVHNDRATSLRMFGTHNTSRGALGAFVIGRY